MQQLVQNYLAVRRLALRHGQHRPDDAADKGALQSRHSHSAAGFEPVFLRDCVNSRADIFPRLTPTAEQRPQPGVAHGVPDDGGGHTHGVDGEEPVGQAHRGRVYPRKHALHAYDVEGRGVGRIQVQLRGAPGRLEPQRQLRYYPARYARRYERAQGEHGPNGVLPARRELIPQQPLHQQQYRRSERDVQRLIQRFPDVAHGYTSISSSMRRSRSASSRDMCDSRRNAAISSPAEPL